METAGRILGVMCGLGFVLMFGGLALDFFEIKRLSRQEPRRRLDELISPRRLLGKRLVLAGIRWIAVWLAAATLWLLWSTPLLWPS
jgi:hypothetical protein